MTILVDTNFFLRLLIPPLPTDDPKLARTAQILFDGAARGDVDFTTTESAFSETNWVAIRFYRLDRSVVATGLVSILMSPGCVLSNRQLYIDALRVWAATPSLSFVDVLVALTADRSGYQLATLDEKLARFSEAPRWIPDEVN